MPPVHWPQFYNDWEFFACDKNNYGFTFCERAFDQSVLIAEAVGAQKSQNKFQEIS